MNKIQGNSFEESEKIKRQQSEDTFNELIKTCFDEGWFPTKCPEGCIARALTESAHITLKALPSNSE